VNGASCWPRGILFEQIVPPPLHLDIGIINKCKKNICDFINELDGQDPAVAARLRDFEEELLELGLMIEDCVEAIEFLLNESGEKIGLRGNVGSTTRATVN
jgi:hypothetical protein